MTCSLIAVRICESEPVTEEQELIFDGIHPIIPIMISRTRSELVRDFCFYELLVQVAVHLIEEITGSAVDGDVQCTGFKKVYHIDHGVVLPVLRVLLNGTQTLRQIPSRRERTDIHAAGETSHRTEDILMSDGIVHRSMTSHRVAGDGTALAVLDGAEVAVNEFDKFF